MARQRLAFWFARRARRCELERLILEPPRREGTNDSCRMILLDQSVLNLVSGYMELLLTRCNPEIDVAF
jgi:hypothetical protein